MDITAYDIAARFIGIREVKGSVDNPQILAMLRLDAKWPENDETPWCSAFCNYIAFLLGLPRSKSLMARSWIRVGKPVAIAEASVGFDIVVLQRGGGNQPGPEVINAPGHVGFYAGQNNGEVLLLGGNQSDGVNVSSYTTDRILAVRRLI